MQKYALLSMAVFLCASTLWADGDVVPFGSQRWQIDGREARVEQHLGRESLYLKGGSAVLNGSTLTNGIIEFDITFGKERGFMGAFWRKQDDRNYEYFYLRPHQSGQPDACQYTPTFNGLTAWQLYHGEGYGAAIDFTFDQWMHVKIVISGRQGEVYVEDMTTPALFISDMKHELAGGEVGVLAGNFSPAWYSNFSYQNLDNVALTGKAAAIEPAPQGSIMRWQVSSTLSEKSLAGVTDLGRSKTDSLSWQKLDCEPTGVANLSRLHRITQERNTVFAKIIIESNQKQIRKLSFGYSDRVKAYINGKLVYAGDNGYRSRDFRYLGTIGLFDELYLPLKKGQNQVWLAVSETFGGWGIKAKLADGNGVEVVLP